MRVSDLKVHSLVMEPWRFVGCPRNPTDNRPFIFLGRKRNSIYTESMAASFYIVVEGEDPGYDIFVNGRALARHEDALERMAERLRVPGLLEFFSADENAVAVLTEADGEPPMWEPQPVQWHSPENGLRTVRALLLHLEQSPLALGTETPAVSGELREYEQVLQKTNLYGLRWHLAVSWK